MNERKVGGSAVANVLTQSDMSSHTIVKQEKAAGMIILPLKNRPLQAVLEADDDPRKMF